MLLLTLMEYEEQDTVVSSMLCTMN